MSPSQDLHWLVVSNIWDSIITCHTIQGACTRLFALGVTWLKTKFTWRNSISFFISLAELSNPFRCKIIVKFTHPALQQIPTHSPLKLCLWLVSSRQGYIIWTVNYPRVMLYPYRALTITSKVQECCGREFAAKLGEFDYSTGGGGGGDS